jgi:hypothetical protein
MRCSQLTAAGERCRSNAVEGSDRCSSHLSLTGPKTKLTPELTRQIAGLIAAGNHIGVACSASGVSRASFYVWWNRGDPFGEEENDAGYRDFRSTIEKARAEGETTLVLRVASDATRNAESAKWLLERSFPERWARISQREKDEHAPVPDVDDDPFREVDELAEQRLRRQGRG